MAFWVRKHLWRWGFSAVILVLVAGFAYIPTLSKAFEFFAAKSPVTDHVPHEVHRLRVDDFINAVAWNADGTRLAALSNFGGNITVWETTNWSVVKQIRRYGGTYSENSLAFLPDGTLLTAAPIGDYSRDPRYANTPLTDPKYKSLAIFSLIQWDLETGRPVKYIPDLGYPPKDLSEKITDTFAVSKDGSLVAGIRLDRVLLYETHGGSLLREMKISMPKNRLDGTRSVVFSPDGQELAVGTTCGIVHFFGSVDGVLRRSFNVYPDEDYSCSALAFSPDGRLIAVGKYANLDGSRIEGKGFVMRESNSTSIKVLRTSDGAIIASLIGSTVKRHGGDDALVVRTLSWGIRNVLAAGDDETFRLWRLSESVNESLLTVINPKGSFSAACSLVGMIAATDRNEIVIYQ